MDRPLQNQEELRQEIVRLKALKHQQGEALAKRFGSPLEIVKTIWSLFPTSAEKRHARLKRFLADPVSFASKLLIPLALRKTLLRKSDFLTRLVVMFSASKLAGLINMKRMAHWIRTVEKYFKKKAQPLDA